MRLRSLADAVRYNEQRSRPDLRPIIDPPKADFGPAVQVDEITSSDLLNKREIASVHARAHAFADFLIVNTQRNGVPLDESAKRIDFWLVFVEAFGISYLRWPEAFPEPPESEDEFLSEEYSFAPLTDQEAFANGLAIAKARPKRLRVAPTLAGCQGKNEDGTACKEFRRKGERYCPAHRAAAIRYLRGLPS